MLLILWVLFQGEGQDLITNECSYRSIILPRAQRHSSDEEIERKKKDRFVIPNKTARPLSYERWCKKMKMECPENMGFKEPVW